MPWLHTSLRARLGPIALAVAGVSVLLPWSVSAVSLSDPAGVFDDAGAVVQRPQAVPVVLTGAQLPAWSQPAVQPVAGGVPFAGPRSAHNGTLTPAVESPTAAKPDEITAFRWDGGRWTEVPVQVDERFPYFLWNPDSDFGIYSQTDMELTYAWDVESWKKTAGVCSAEYSAGESAMADPAVRLDDDDEIVFMPDDAGERAPFDARGPVGTGATRQEVAVTDPVAGTVSYVYLFTRPGGSSFDASTGYVHYQRDANADQWVDRSFWPSGDPESLGTSNTGYGPNLSGTVCPDGTPASAKSSDDRFARDGVTVTTDAYKWTATGRWMVRGMQVAKPGQPGVFGPDLIDRWKGRAFQQSPDSSISVVGFEDEQVNWEANSSLLGERQGPVRAIREAWGADSGTNVTKTETFYRDAVTYRYHLRVHPIPPDGLYTSWDYNKGVAVKYFTPTKPDGVDIDGVNDEIPQTNNDSLAGQPAFFDAPDPTLNIPLSLLTWEQVSGAGDAGSLVYLFENKGPTSLTEPTVVPYYRDDECLDDGTGDNPVPRPMPGEAAASIPGYLDKPCSERQGAYGSHGVHFFVTSDTDNAFLPSPQPVNEVDAQQWQFAVPTAAPVNVGERYNLEVRVPRVAIGVAQPSTPLDPTTIEVSAPAAVQATDTFSVTVTVTGAPAGSEVVIASGDVSRTVSTDDAGHASVSFAAGRDIGPRRVTATYAGDAAHAPSRSETDVDVVREASVASVAISGPRPSSLVDVRLTDDDAALIGGVIIDVLVNGAPVASVTTSSDGAASAVVRLKRGDVVEVRFAGDGVFEPASATATRS